VADRLIKHEFHGYARIGAGEYSGKGLLFIDGVLSQDSQVLLNRRRPIRDHPLIACEQCLQSSVGTQIVLGLPLLRKRQPHSSLRGDANNRTGQNLLKDLSPADICSNMRLI
jgi:hypothetical protein